MPSNHVCPNFESPGFPQFLYQAPPGPQQLLLPDFLRVAHMGHPLLLIAEVLAIVAVVAGAAIIM